MLGKILVTLLVAALSAMAQTMPIGPYGQIPFRTGNVAADTATLTVGQMSGLLTGTPVSAAAYTTPTATQLCAAFPFVAAGNIINFHWEWHVKNTGADTDAITVTAGAGVTVTGTATVAQNAVHRFMIVLDTCNGTPAAHVISLGSSTF